ncbi:MAG: HaeIII family restriction endonuclease [Schwartzia succinivorans]|nr:HaeIII family restriction endonuclease [Schwartzia succinivorans]
MGKEKKSLVRSGAAEYLTYIASVGNEENFVELRYEDENIWLTQKAMAQLYDVTVAAINQHIKRIFADKELDESAVIKKYLITADDGKHYQANHYNLQMIIAVGFKVNSERAVQFRKWVNYIAKEYTIKGWVMDDERLKRGTYLTDKYYEEQLERIREIRASERKFYQKVTDIYATAVDYDNTAKSTRRFYATVQNKMHFAVHGVSCSKEYFDVVVPLFTELRKYRDDSKEAGTPMLWEEIEDKAERYYKPLLEAFMKELKRIADENKGIPEALIRYLLGRNDFYKVITDDKSRTTRVEAINIAGTLNSSSGDEKAITKVPILKMPTQFYHIGFKPNSDNTVEVVCDEGWQISMRIHNASSRVEPSLKFDVQLISFPSSVYAQVEPWESEEERMTKRVMAYADKLSVKDNQ